MRKRTARWAWLIIGGIALALLAIGATSYVMRLDEEAARSPVGKTFEPTDQDRRRVTERDAAGRLMVAAWAVRPAGYRTASM